MVDADFGLSFEGVGVHHFEGVARVGLRDRF